MISTSEIMIYSGVDVRFAFEVLGKDNAYNIGTRFRGELFMMSTQCLTWKISSRVSIECVPPDRLI